MKKKFIVNRMDERGEDMVVEVERRHLEKKERGAYEGESLENKLEDRNSSRKYVRLQWP
jgi:hypothetical protein